MPTKLIPKTGLRQPQKNALLGAYKAYKRALNANMQNPNFETACALETAGSTYFGLADGCKTVVIKRGEVLQFFEASDSALRAIRKRVRSASKDRKGFDPNKTIRPRTKGPTRWR